VQLPRELTAPYRERYEAHLTKARAYIAAKNYDAAETELLAIKAVRGYDHHALRQLHKLWTLAGDKAKAKKYFDEMNDPKSGWVTATNEPTTVAAYAERAEENDGPGADAALEKAVAALRPFSGGVLPDLPALSASSTRKDKMVRAWVAAGIVHHEDAKRLPLFRKAYALDAKNAILAFYVGYTLRELQKQEEYEPYWNQAEADEAVAPFVRKAREESFREFDPPPAKPKQPEVSADPAALGMPPYSDGHWPPELRG
jgi:hypothetical protein